MSKLLPNRTLFETFPAMIVTIDLSCIIIDCNETTETFLGYKKEELLKRSVETLLYSENGNHFWEYLETALSGRQEAYQISIIKKNGSLLPIQFLLFPFYKGQDVKGVRLVAPVVLENRNSHDSNSTLEATIKEFNDIKFALDQSADITITDTNGTILYTNDRLCKITQYKPQELLGKNHRILNSNLHTKQFFKEMWDTITAGNVWHGEIRNQKKDGTYYWADSTIVPFLDEYGRPYQYIAIWYDITQRKELEEKVQQQTYFDALTLLPNRHMLEDLIEKEILLANINGKFALYMLTINRLKFVNDTLGHKMGDKLLRTVAKRISATATKHGWQAGRFSGDQFCVIVSKIDDEQISKIANKLIDMFKEPFTIQEYQLYITTNIGISIFPDSGDNSQTLFKNADIALYRSIELKRGSFEVYSSVMDIHAYKQFSLMNDIYKAFKRGEFVLYYQPIVDLKMDKSLSAEALIRWKHEDWALITPDEFIPLSEETGLIVSITEWVIHEVCKQLQQWRKEGIKPVRISVNLSAHDLMRKDFVEIVKKAVQEYRIKPEFLQFEITERIVAKNDELVLSTLQRLKDFGVLIALDDFGTGYSSLSLLKLLPVDTVKIDKTFTENLFENSKNLKFLKSMVQFLKELDLVTVVEGVETKQQLTKIMEFDCDKIQGFFISHPIPETEFKNKFLKSNQARSLEQFTDFKKDNIQTKHTADQNRRRFFRVDLKYPLGGRMTIQTIDGKKVSIGKTKILIEDIGPGGIRFLSNLKLPVNPNMIFEFETKIFGKFVVKHGHVVWGKQYSNLIYEYGMELLINESDRTELVKLLNSLIVKLRHGPLASDCEFVISDFQDYLSGEK